MLTLLQTLESGRSRNHNAVNGPVNKRKASKAVVVVSLPSDMDGARDQERGYQKSKSPIVAGRANFRRASMVAKITRAFKGGRSVVPIVSNFISDDESSPRIATI